MPVHVQKLHQETLLIQDRLEYLLNNYLDVLYLFTTDGII